MTSAPNRHAERLRMQARFEHDEPLVESLTLGSQAVEALVELALADLLKSSLADRNIENGPAWNATVKRHYDATQRMHTLARKLAEETG